MSQIDITETVDFHFVIPDAVGEMFGTHTHGLEAFGHKEFQVLVPGYCRQSAIRLLMDHANAVINEEAQFVVGQRVATEGVTVGYEEVPGDHPADPARLRIVDVQGGCECAICGGREAGQSSTDQVHEQFEYESQCVLPKTLRAAMARIDNEMERLIRAVLSLPDFPEQESFADVLVKAWLEWGIPCKYDERSDRSEDLGAFLRRQMSQLTAIRATQRDITSDSGKRSDSEALAPRSEDRSDGSDE